MLDRKPETIPWQCWSAAEAGVGETPMWDADTESLYWVDLYGPTLSRSEGPGASVTSWTLPDMVGAYGLGTGDEGAVVAVSSGIYVLDLATGALALTIPAPYDPASFRFNDGRCDPVGRFWVGTNRQPGSGQPRGSASFYRLDDRGLSREIDGITIANGLAFSPEGSTLYLADAVEHRLLAYDYDLDSGSASGPRVFAHLQDGLFPDGAAVDVDGGYWIAMYGSGIIVRFTPEGSVDRVLRAPVTHPTMVAFGGPSQSTMFVTSARRFAEPETLQAEPLAGGVFAADVRAQGMPEPRFAFFGDLRAPAQHTSTRPIRATRDGGH